MQRVSRTITAALSVASVVAIAACGDEPLRPKSHEPTGLRPALSLASSTSLPQLSAGIYHTCALKADRTVACWGAGTVNLGAHPYWGQAIVPAGLAGVAQVSAGGYHTCALTTDGTVSCWGHDNGGEPMPQGISFTHISAGVFHVCALDASGIVNCWEDTRFGVATPPAGAFTLLSASPESWFDCGIRADGTVACWGENGYGQTNAPGGTFLQVSAGGDHSCGVRADGSIACWGAGSTNTGVNPHFGQSMPPAGTFAAVGTGLVHSCGLRTDGSITCWGAGSTNTGTFPNYGQAIPPAGVFTQLTVGAHHNCALRSDGIVICWGYNAFGQASPPDVRLAQTITFTSTPPGPAYVGDTYAVSATGGSSGNPVTFSSLTPAVCGVSANSVSFLAVGMCSVAASQAGDVTFQPARRVAQSVVVVSKRPQAITFTSVPPSPALLGGNYAASATGGGSGNPVVLSSLTPAVCPLSGTTVSFVAVGTCTVAADQAGSASYLDAPQATQSFAVVYDFGAGTGGGFTDPVSNTGFNSARAGQAVPVGFDLGGDQGLLVVAAGYPQSAPTACPNASDPVNVVPEATLTAGGSSLTYDPTTGLYTYVWKTDKAWVGACREFVLKLADNTEHKLKFQFAR